MIPTKFLMFVVLSAFFGMCMSISSPDHHETGSTFAFGQDFLKSGELKFQSSSGVDGSIIPDIDTFDLSDDDRELSSGYEVPDLSNSCLEKCNLMQEVCKECLAHTKVCKNVTSQVCVKKDVSPRKTVEDWVRCAPVKKKVCKNTYTYTCKEIPQSKCKEVLISEMVWVMAEQCQGSIWGKQMAGWTQSQYAIQRLFKRSSSHKKKLTSNLCWPEKKWQSVPKWKTVCNEEWINVCEETPKPVCETVLEEVCVVVQVEEILPLPPVDSCDDVINEVCEEGAQCIIGDLDCISSYPDCLAVCLNCEDFCNGS